MRSLLPALLAILLIAPAPAEPIVQGAVAALAEDASAYGQLYGLSLGDAIRELSAQQASVPATDAIRARFSDRLAGLFLDHEGGLRVVVLLKGDEPVAAETIEAAGLSIPVEYRTGAAATRAQILAAIEAHQADIRGALTVPPAMGVDAQTGSLVIMVKATDIPAEGTAPLIERFGAMTGVPIEVRMFASVDANLAATGGGRVVGEDPANHRRGVCTSGFVVTDGEQTALTTAAHCPDALSYVEPDGGAHLPLTMIGAWGARYQDVQIHTVDSTAAPLQPFFYADTAKTLLRPVDSWRNRESTRVGDVVCHRGERTGYSCAEVAFVDFAPPGDLCAGPCPATWVAVRGPTCRGGDSGAPVFSGTIAFGLVKGASYTEDGNCRLYYYMSVDYLPPGWTVLHR